MGRSDLRETLRNRYILPLGPESCETLDAVCKEQLRTPARNPLSGYGLVHFPDLFVATRTHLGYMGMNGRMKRLGDKRPEEWSALKVLPDGSMWAVASGPSRRPAQTDGRMFRITFDERTGAQLWPEDLTRGALLREPAAVDVDGEGRVYVLDLYGAPYPEVDPGPGWMTDLVYEPDGETPRPEPFGPLAGIPPSERMHFLQDGPYRETWQHYLRVAQDGAPMLHVFDPNGLLLASHPLPFLAQELLDRWYDRYVPTLVDLAVTPDGEVYLLYRGHDVIVAHGVEDPVWYWQEHVSEAGAIYRYRPEGGVPLRVLPADGDDRARVGLPLWEQMARSAAGDFYVASHPFQQCRNGPLRDLRITRHAADGTAVVVGEEAQVLGLMGFDVSAEEDVLAVLSAPCNPEGEPARHLRVFNRHASPKTSVLAIHDEAIFLGEEDIVAIDFLRP